jgi:glycosyltransferase involved in cell wall biosynthesis
LIGVLTSSISRSQRSILFVVSSLAVGGTEKHVASIAAALRQRGWNVAVYCTGEGGPLAESIEASGNSVIRASYGELGICGLSLSKRVLRIPVVAAHLFSVLWKKNFTIVHFFLPEAYLVGAPLAIFSGIKLLIMSRRSLNAYQRKHHIASFLERRLHSRMTAVLANSRSVAKELESEGVRAERLGLIYNGLDTEVRAPNGRKRTRDGLGIRDATLVFVIVANLIPYKGHLDLVEALGKVDSKLSADWQLLIVGREHGAGAAVKALAASLGIADKITFLGARNDVPDLLSAGDIGLSSSHEEGFSNAVLEGMRSGLPMIVTNVGGNAEAVVNGETGLVVPPRDPPAFADAILRLASDPQLRRSFGANGRRRVEQCFALSSCVAAYEALYSGLVAGKLPNNIEEIRYRA